MPEATTTEATADEDVLTVTDDAAERLVDELEDKEDVQALRMLAQEGCCGYGYALAMAKRAPNDDETVVEANGVTVYLDEATLGRVRGATIAWNEGVFGAGFTIENPNEPDDEAACGCK